MQVATRYLVNNRTDIILNDAGFITEYRPVYNRNLIVYSGIDNVLQFRLLNSDQKPIKTLADYTIKFQAFDENKSLIIEHNGVIVNASKGLFKVTLSENDLLNVKEQFLSYNIYLVDSDGNNVITYSGAHFAGCGTIKIDACQYPGPRETYSISTFIADAVKANYWASETLNAEPGINGNEALHTAVIYTDGYADDVVVQATLDNQVTDGTIWADISTVTFDGTETEPTPVNFNGVFSHLRFKALADPADKISKILVRN